MCEVSNVGVLHVDRTASALSNEARDIRGRHLVLVAGGIIWDRLTAVCHQLVTEDMNVSYLLVNVLISA